MIDKLGLKKPSGGEIVEERDAQMRSQYIDPIEHFPNKIDQLLTVLTRVSPTTVLLPTASLCFV